MDCGSVNEQPNTRASPSPVSPGVSQAAKDRLPLLGPECPRPLVRPPLNNNLPTGSNRRACPDVWAPKRAASIPSSSQLARTPGIATAWRHKSVGAQSAPSGLKNRTSTSTGVELRSKTRRSSSMLTRVHGQRGCAARTSVKFPGERSVLELRGQSPGLSVAAPGVRSYFSNAKKPPDKRQNPQAGAEEKNRHSFHEQCSF